MAFEASNFDPGASSKGAPNIARYRTADNAAVVQGAGYFSDPIVSTALKTGDFIFCAMGDAASIYQLTVSGATVTLSREAAFGAVV